MKLDSYGILISLRPFSERDSVARIFTYDCGVMVGMMRGANVARKNKPLVGQVGSVSWNARLDSQLGVFHWDAEKNLSAPLMLDSKKLAFMNSAFDLICTLLPERERYDALYNETINLLQSLADTDDESSAYLRWEVRLLQELGYALDLSHCSGCGARDNLNWLSPKTGRAVCDNCAMPYIKLLYKLPLDLGVTARFLDSVCLQQGTTMPMARGLIKK